MYSCEFSWELNLPVGDDIHQAVVTFLRTSSSGIWQQNTDEKSDALVMHFRRGDWGKAVFSKKLVPGWPKRPDLCAMTLRVTVRPTPQDMRIGLHFVACLPSAPTSVVAPIELRKFNNAIELHCAREAEDFANYLHRYYQIELPPKLSSSPAR